jgi:TolB-like protein/class 3 adenylate cyclase/Tfp pilus assembly protein PilF
VASDDAMPHRRLAAILFADVVGYSRSMEQDEAGTLAVLKERQKSIIEPAAASFGGRIVKLMGDGVLIEFTSAVNAVKAALELQTKFGRANENLPEAGRFKLRIGINLGDVVGEGSDIFGDGVNVAARLESLAEPEGICISAKVHDEIEGKVSCRFEDGGEHSLKNLSKPVRIYHLRQKPLVASAQAALLDRPSIAVLPFVNFSSDPDQAYFADGLTEDLITDLSRTSGLFVIARNSSFAYKGKSLDARRIASELGVRYLLEGSARRAQNRVRINVQLIDARNGGHMWAERFDRDLADVFAVQDEITAKIVEALIGHLIPRPARNKPKNIEAYDLFVRARVLTAQSIYATRAALPLLEQVIELDPDFAEAHAWLAMNLTFQQIDGKQIPRERILAEAERAVSLDPGNAQGYFVRGYVLAYAGNLTAGLEQFALALQYNPNLADAWLYLSDLKVFDGKTDEAIDAVERAFKLDPHPHPTFHWLRAFAFYAAGKYEEAVAALQNEACQGTGAQRILAAALAQLGRFLEAREAARRFLAAYPHFSTAAWAKTQPFRDASALKHFVEGYRKAGLPE